MCKNLLCYIGLPYRIGNLDRAKPQEGQKPPRHLGDVTPVPGVRWVNMTGPSLDGVDVKTLSKLELSHRKQIWKQIQEVRNTPGYEEVFLMETAPQIGVQKRLICMLTDKPYVIINPALEFVGDEMMELMDDCMSFPKLLVRVRRYRHCILRYLDENWVLNEKQMDDDMSELIQHEYDHLDGILATMRAIDNKSFVMKQ